MKILITGAAGFIGSRLMYDLADRGEEVVGIDNINDYYNPQLKIERLKQCGIAARGTDIPMGEDIVSSRYANCHFIRMSIDDKDGLDALFAREKFDKVVNLAAQAGVRYSITNPYAYLQSNLVGFLNILEACRNYGIAHLIFASSSSVYGLNEKTPFSEDDKVCTPVSLYAATKLSNEHMAHCYSKLYNIRTTGLRFFTVYGPWGRPDMAPMLFANALHEDKPIKVYNHGNMLRDFTYIDDVVAGIIGAIYQKEENATYRHGVRYTIYNIGCSSPVRLMDFIHEMELAYGKTFRMEMLPMQPGDVYQTYADTTRLEKEVGYKPSTSLRDGIREFIEWYRVYISHHSL